MTYSRHGDDYVVMKTISHVIFEDDIGRRRGRQTLYSGDLFLSLSANYEQKFFVTGGQRCYLFWL